MRNRALHKKALRDLRRRLSQVSAIAITVMLGVLLFVASYDSFRNLSVSYQRTYDRLHLADLTAIGGNPTAIADAVRGADGVARVMTRTQADRPVQINGTKLVGRVVGIPPDSTAGIDQIDVTAGRPPDPARPNQVVVELHAANTFHLDLGDRLQVFDGTAWRDLTVGGIATSAEYLWPARSRQDILVDPHAFAVLFAPQQVASSLDGGRGPNQTLVEMSRGATGTDLARVTSLLRSAGAADVQTQDEQPSNAALHEDLTGFSEISVGFPVLFLAAAAIAGYVLITRLVQAERPTIGMLLAMGARRSAVVRHYVWYGATIAAVGAALGAVAGAVATSAVTSAYTSALGIPDTIIEHRIGTAAAGFAFGVLTGVGAALAPAISAARNAPAEAMRGDGVRAVRVGPLARLSARWKRLPVVVRMALRSLTRSRRRTAATMMGSVLALVVILASVGLMTSMVHVLRVQFSQVQREDATVIAAPGAEEVGVQLHSVPGVTTVEPATLARISVQADGRSYETTLTGLQPDTSMHGFRAAGGGSAALPDDGILAGAALADRLGVRAGATVTVVPAVGSPRQVRLAGLVDEPLGTLIYATNSTAASLSPVNDRGYLLRFADGTDRDSVRAAVSRLPGVVAYSDTKALERQIDEFLSLFWVFVGVMLALGAVLAFAVIYVTMTVSLAERTTELATMRAQGVSIRRLTAMLATENLAATMLGLPIGLAAGVGAAWVFVHSFNSDLFTFGLSLGWVPLTLAAVAVLAAAAVSQLPAARIVKRIDVARVVRERAQ